MRENRSPYVSRLPPLTYMIISMEPRDAIESFVRWVSNTAGGMTGGGGATERDVVMVAHNGMCHDHVVLIKTMMRWSISPPKWRFADSLPIFKLVMRPDEDCTLATLAEVYAPWYIHVRHDALSDAMALKNAVLASVPDWQTACLTFSSTCEYFMKAVGLNTNRMRQLLPFPPT